MTAGSPVAHGKSIEIAPDGGANAHIFMGG
jgi:hypothetical protein